MFIAELLRALDRERIRYCLIGGVAVNLHGIPRITYDVDIVVAPERQQLDATERLLRGLGLQARIPVRLEDFADEAYRDRMLEERNLVAVTFTDPSAPLREVDVVVAPPVSASELVARAREMDAGGFPARVAALEDLIELKQRSGREQDAADVRLLERILAERNDG